MIKKNSRQIWIVPVVLALAILACRPAAAPTASPLPGPTQVPFPTETTAAPRPTQVPFPTETTAAPQPTTRPVATKAPVEPTVTTAADQPTPDNSTAPAPFELSATPFVHKSGAFTVTLPVGWTTSEQSYLVWVTSPDQKVTIDISFVNVGVKFDAPTLDTYIKALEANWFGTFAGYSAGKFLTQSNGSIGVLKTLIQSNGLPRTVFSYYWQDGTVVFEQDYWVPPTQYDTYVKPLLKVANSLQVNSGAVATFDAYRLVYTFTDPGKLFKFDVPHGWTHASSTDSASSSETFTSPDKHSYFQNIKYDDGKTLTKSESGTFAKKFLKVYYKLSDLMITKDQILGDGTQVLVWKSAAGGVDGNSFFKTHGSTWLLLTWVVNSPDYNLFYPVWSSLGRSYNAVPK